MDINKSCYWTSISDVFWMVTVKRNILRNMQTLSQSSLVMCNNHTVFFSWMIHLQLEHRWFGWWKIDNLFGALKPVSCCLYTSQINVFGARALRCRTPKSHSLSTSSNPKERKKEERKYALPRVYLTKTDIKSLNICSFPQSRSVWQKFVGHSWLVSLQFHQWNSNIRDSNIKLSRMSHTSRQPS